MVEEREAEIVVERPSRMRKPLRMFLRILRNTLLLIIFFLIVLSLWEFGGRAPTLKWLGMGIPMSNEEDLDDVRAKQAELHTLLTEQTETIVKLQGELQALKEAAPVAPAAPAVASAAPTEVRREAPVLTPEEQRIKRYVEAQKELEEVEREIGILGGKRKALQAEIRALQRSR